MNGEKTQLDRLVEAVSASPKYRHICKDFIRSIGEQELAKRRNLRQAIKATKNKLHQVGGAYLDGRANYAAWLDQLRRASQSGDRDDFLRACIRIMGYHSSTRERLEILDRFYITTLAHVPPIRTVLDVACGLNPLAIPWMPLAEGAAYYAYDIYQDMIEFLDAFGVLAGVRIHARACDVIRSCPTQEADVAFVLKAIPCLEQVDRSAGPLLLESLNTQYVLVSFPAHSLGGRDRGMVVNYEARFRQMVAGKNWKAERFEFATELAFLITR